MIFAAGLGTRMGELTRDRPKPLIEVAGRPLIDHALALVRAAGVRRIVVNTHAHPGQMRAHLARVAPEALISHEPVRLETGGGLKQALPLLGPGPVFTLNADMVWRGPNPLDGARRRLATGRRRAPRAGAAGARRSATPARATSSSTPDGRLRRRGAAATRGLRLRRGADHRPRARSTAFPTASSRSTRVWDALIAEGRLRGIVHPGGWVDVGRPEGIALAEAELAR